MAHVDWARLQSKTGKSKVFYYYFDQHPDYPADSPQAGRGIAARSGSVLRIPAPESESAARQIGRSISEAMATYWTNFAKYGDIPTAGVPAWPAFSDANPEVMYFAQTPPSGPGAQRRITQDP